MKNKALKIANIILSLLPLVLVAALYSRLPQQIPTHWGIDGTVTYGGKGTLWFLALLSPFFGVLFPLLPKIDPRRQNYQRFQGYYDAFCTFMLLFFLVIIGVTLSESLNPGRIRVGQVVMFLVGGLFLFLGNILPKIKSNFFMGFKNPWTLSDPDVWNRTHRLGGILFFITGLALLLGAFFLPEEVMFWLLMGLILVTTLVPSVMSYLWYRQVHPKE